VDAPLIAADWFKLCSASLTHSIMCPKAADPQVSVCEDPRGWRIPLKMGDLVAPHRAGQNPPADD
jgi:hypothetical protein